MTPAMADVAAARTARNRTADMQWVAEMSRRTARPLSAMRRHLVDEAARAVALVEAIDDLTDPGGVS